ncbi:phage major capsid protein [Schinkia azotoformans]|uniref:phage major capsid protein n=1 Tax=Schinkia azotoformans TaxID=1454 RepID=UPI002DBB2B25|nr:phage major capsid protein [Schinkia azotoformans]MEC1780070.1 phage major capsid protein [Schinkia azotoformans]MED4330851.1 phage major capsid protein [Schinkia azotoformans]
MAFLKDELQGFVPTEQANEIMKDVAKGSTILKLSKVEDMKSDKKVIPVMTDGVGAYWVGESERIQTSAATWIYPEIVAKKLAVIIPVTKEKLNDTTIDVFNELRPSVAEAFYKAIDAAALFGTNSPFAKNILGSVATTGNEVVLGTGASLDLDVSDVMALIEDAGLDASGFAGHRGIKNKLRKLRDANNVPLFDGNTSELYNLPIEFVANGSFDKTKAELIAGNFDYSLVGVRQGIEYEILKEATLHSVTMADGKPLSLAENDMVALKATMRIGFLPVKDEAFAVLRPTGYVGA